MVDLWITGAFPTFHVLVLLIFQQENTGSAAKTSSRRTSPHPPSPSYYPLGPSVRVVTETEQETPPPAVRPLFRPALKNITVAPGERASLKCRVDNLGTKTVVWRKDGDNNPLTIGLFPFAADSRIAVDFNVRSSEWTLSIQDVRPTDEGLYHCQISTKDGSENTFGIQLNVKTVQVFGTDYVERGTPIRLTCNATGRPDPPHDVYWYKDGLKVLSDQPRGVIVSKKIETRLLMSTLVIASSRSSDAGSYLCVSSEQDSASLTVHVLPISSTLGKRGTFSESMRSSASDQPRLSSYILCNSSFFDIRFLMVSSLTFVLHMTVTYLLIPQRTSSIFHIFRRPIVEMST